MPRAQYDEWLKSLPEELCTFCEWQDYQIVLASTNHWLWILNRSPYWKYHTMLIPRRHVVEMSDLSVVETGELFTIYAIAVDALRNFQSNLPEGERTGKYIFFWRFRSEVDAEVSDQRKLSHFHLHLAPDRERMFDPLLDKDAHEVDYIPLLNIAKRLPSQVNTIYNGS
ncbi:Diadenosine tetraphosphate (Ap4A) hydrolase [Plantibacter sp. VKM Ac-1784]|uniref:Diadenosine tetraphosphate (Ap4A) hydrolase n=2 Tax=Plantibacter elymi (nom. nud.) TaxID=199708 RepID=A0ABY1REH0_9MICO|nr:HIT domain-containing protein [Plantibacter sp. VKM Ac-1784]SMQ72342.1 Diadenosine tetraphosphate (Ap4A) hydrolase [Plantibacter sp. VKM Ac-1784]